MRFEGAQNYEDAVAKAADESGIQRDYWDIFHRRHEPSTEVRRKILQSLGWNVAKSGKYRIGAPAFVPAEIGLPRSRTRSSLAARRSASSPCPIPPDGR